MTYLATVEPSLIHVSSVHGVEKNFVASFGVLRATLFELRNSFEKAVACFWQGTFGNHFNKEHCLFHFHQRHIEES